MDKDYLKNIIIDQRELITQKLESEKVVVREGLTRCEIFISHPNILLISGLRRAGKSFFSHLLAKKAAYAFINFDDERLVDIKTKDLNLVMECFYDLYKEFEFLLLDEIQNVAGWELFVNRLRNKYKIIITGSNANLLSKELATHLTGRYSDFSLYPLSFKEFLKFKSVKLNNQSLHSTKKRSEIYSLFSGYLNEGGIFEYYKFGKEFLRNLYSSIITKDIVLRYNIKYPVVLEELALLLVNYFTNKISVNNITKNLEIKSPHTTKEYINYLENSFIIFTVNKFSYKLKEQLSSFKKLYVTDNGIINSLIFDYSQNKGNLLENLVAIELKRKSGLEGSKFFYWDNYSVKCDFIVKRGKKIVSAYQVCSQITLENREREYAGLVAALKEFGLKEGTILTDSTEEELKVEGLKLKIIPVWKWLLTN